MSFTVKDNKALKLNSKFILLPDLSNNGMLSFDWWYKDKEYTNPLKNFEIGKATNLYGRFGNIPYTITFETKDGVPVAEPITASYLSVVELPKKARGFDKYAVSFWRTIYGRRWSGTSL